MAASGGPGDLGAVSLLSVDVEVAGCRTVCRHCWAQGVGYGAMPLADIEWVLEEAHRFCDGAGLAFDAYPMHEMAAHPDAARLFALFNKRGASGRGGTMFEPLTTTGVPLTVREDWRDVLRAAADTGTLNIWVAFHGVGEVHDRQVNRSGAYAETCLAVERARSVGLSVGRQRLFDHGQRRSTGQANRRHAAAAGQRGPLFYGCELPADPAV
jgi:hypothetical protein